MAHLVVPRRILLWMDPQLATQVSEVLLGSSLEVQLAHVSGVGAIEAEWRRPSDIIICDLAGARQIPEQVRRACPTLILIAEDFASAASATYRLQALYCPSSELGRLLEAVGAARPRGASSTHAFEDGQRELLERIAACEPLPGILDGIVRLIEDQGRDMVCSILLLQDDGRLKHGAAPSLAPEFVRAIDGSPIGPEEGCCGAAAFRKMPIFVEDVLSHEYWAKFRHLIQPLGFRGCWSSPIYSSDGAVTGTFAIYHREPRLPTEWELSLVARATHLASIAIERDRVEQALRRSEARYRQIVDTAYEGVWGLGRDGETWFANARAAELLGTTPEAILGRSVFEFVDEADRAQTEAYLRSRAQGRSEQSELRFRRVDGSDFWALVAASPICGDDGTVVGWLGMLTDITQLKRTEATLRKSEEEFRSIFENAAIGMAVVGNAGRVLRSNGALQRLLGYRDEELSQMRFDMFTHPQDLAADLELYRRLSEGTIKSYQLEKRFIRSDGEIVWGRFTASSVRVTEGEPLLGIGMIEDVTQSRLAQERIAWQAALLDQANDAIIVRDLDGQIQYWNDGAERLYGWSRREATGRTVQELIYRDASALVEPHRELRKRGVWTGELVHVTRSGKELAIRANWTLVRDEHGAAKSVL
ncbi:MAG TPA: PAS domain S-box protein, partial [Polyangiaceae bacterium]|nr:PAS domain S-box protein [Polyangiaceae bacterium]